MLSESRVLRIGDWRVDPDLDELSREGRTIRVEPRTMQLLLYLAAHAGRVIDVQQLLDTVWSNVVVTQGSVYQAVAELRRVLGDDREHPSYLENLPKRGYRLIAPVAPWNAGNGAAPSDSTLKDKKEEETLSMQASVAAAGGAATTSASAAPPTPRTAARALGSRGWIGGGLIVLAIVAASWAIAHYRGGSKPAALTSPRVPPAIHSLVVLPLENLSGDKEQEYFADGMTDALTTDLAQIGSLRIISRTSAMHFKGSRETLPQIGHDLQVDAAVEGTVARGENRVRVTAQLVEARTDRHLWAKSYERDLKDVLALQDEIAQDITEQIRVKLTPKERSLLMQVHTVDPEAYDDSLRGWYWCNQFTLEGASKALNYFQKAIAKDPSYALAYAGLADSFLLYGIAGDKKALSSAREAAVKALALDPSLAEAHTALATIKLLNDWDWSGAEAEYKQAITLNPNSARAHFEYSSYLVTMGRLDEAMNQIDRARDLDPFSPDITWWLGQVLYHSRRFDDALRQNQLGLDMHPEASNFYVAMADVYEQKKMFAEAFAARQQARSLVKDPNMTALGEAYKRSGYRGYLLKEAEMGGNNPAYAAHIYALLNDEPRAMTALEVGYKERFPGILFIRTSPELDSIRSSPRFRDLLRRIGFPPSPSDKN